MKIQKKNSGGGGRVGWGVRVDVNEELKFLRIFTKTSSQMGNNRSPESQKVIKIFEIVHK